MHELLTEQMVAELLAVARSIDWPRGPDAVQIAYAELLERVREDELVLQQIETENYLIEQLRWRIGNLRRQDAIGGFGVSFEETVGVEDPRGPKPQRDIDVKEHLALERELGWRGSLLARLGTWLRRGLRVSLVLVIALFSATIEKKLATDLAATQAQEVGRYEEQMREALEDLRRSEQQAEQQLATLCSERQKLGPMAGSAATENLTRVMPLDQLSREDDTVTYHQRLFLLLILVLELLPLIVRMLRIAPLVSQHREELREFEELERQSVGVEALLRIHEGRVTAEIAALAEEVLDRLQNGASLAGGREP